MERRKSRRRIDRRPRPVGDSEASSVESEAEAGGRRTLSAKCIGRRGGSGRRRRVVGGVQQGSQVPRDYQEGAKIGGRGIGYEGLDKSEQEVNSMMTARPARSRGHVESAEGVGESGAVSGGPRRGSRSVVGRRKSGRRAGRRTRIVRRRQQLGLVGGCLPVDERQRVDERLRSRKRGRQSGGHVRERPGSARVGSARSVQ